VPRYKELSRFNVRKLCEEPEDKPKTKPLPKAEAVIVSVNVCKDAGIKREVATTVQAEVKAEAAFDVKPAAVDDMKTLKPEAVDEVKPEAGGGGATPEVNAEQTATPEVEVQVGGEQVPAAEAKPEAM
jgi:hypothetical protein